jgi:hypothetical protein
MLRQAALDAIMRHGKARTQLAIAKLQYDRPKIRILEPVVERLLQARRDAVGAYQEHIDRHSKREVASAGMT